MSGSGVYINFGRSMGYMNGVWRDVHGAGAQRADQKSGDPSNYSMGHGPQGDAVRIYNYARCVTGGVSDEVVTGRDTNANANGLPSNAGDQGGQLGQGQNGPLKAAIDACSGLNQGGSCSFCATHGTVEGTCHQIQSQIARAPEGGPGE
jgi:hypothetical protein